MFLSVREFAALVYSGLQSKGLPPHCPSDGWVASKAFSWMVMWASRLTTRHSTDGERLFYCAPPSGMLFLGLFRISCCMALGFRI